MVKRIFVTEIKIVISVTELMENVHSFFYLLRPSSCDVFSFLLFGVRAAELVYNLFTAFYLNY